MRFEKVQGIFNEKYATSSICNAIAIISYNVNIIHYMVDSNNKLCHKQSLKMEHPFFSLRYSNESTCAPLPQLKDITTSINCEFLLIQNRTERKNKQP